MSNDLSGRRHRWSGSFVQESQQVIRSRYIPLVTAFAMSLYMVSIMTFVITWANTGMDQAFLQRWWRAFYIAWPIAFALILVGAPRITRAILSLKRDETQR